MRGLIGCQGQGRLTESDKTGNCLHGPGATALEKHAGRGELHFPRHRLLREHLFVPHYERLQSFLSRGFVIVQNHRHFRMLATDGPVRPAPLPVTK